LEKRERRRSTKKKTRASGREESSRVPGIVLNYTATASKIKKYELTIFKV